MDKFKVLYYPNSECNGYVLARATLVFDEITFFDHPSLVFQSMGTVGHDSGMRAIAPALLKEGYKINIVKPTGGVVEGELEKIIDADLTNKNYRDTFMRLVRNDPSFLTDMVHDGNYGKYGTAENLRSILKTIPESQVPHTVDEIRSHKPKDGISPEHLIAMSMALDSYKFNLASYLSTEKDVQLFGDSVGMDLLLNAKFSGSEKTKNENKSIAHSVAFTLLEHMIPDEAFKGKSIKDTIRFRNEMAKEREKYKERILEITSDIISKNGSLSQKQLEEILYKKLLPEIRGYQNKMADNWEKLFKDSLKSVMSDSHHITQFIITSLVTQSIAAVMLASALRVGMKVAPHVIDYFAEKSKLNRSNPYIYLMKFH
jgi:hypothetical protein